MLCKKIVIVTALLVTTNCFATIPSNKNMQINELIQSENNRAVAHQHHQTQAIQKKIYKMFRWFNTLSSPRSIVRKHDINKYFTANIRVYKNSKLIGSGREQIYNALRLFQQHVKVHKIKMLRVVLPFKKIVIDSSGTKVTLGYSIIKENSEGQRKVIPGHTVLHLKDHKIERWYQTYS